MTKRDWFIGVALTASLALMCVVTTTRTAGYVLAASFACDAIAVILTACPYREDQCTK